VQHRDETLPGAHNASGAAACVRELKNLRNFPGQVSIASTTRSATLAARRPRGAGLRGKGQLKRHAGTILLPTTARAPCINATATPPAFVLHTYMISSAK
jgi:hypothetical protein